MTIKDFCKIINENTLVEVIDEYGIIDKYNVKELITNFHECTPIIEIQAFDYNFIGIRLGRL